MSGYKCSPQYSVSPKTLNHDIMNGEETKDDEDVREKNEDISESDEEFWKTWKSLKMSI